MSQIAAAPVLDTVKIGVTSPSAEAESTTRLGPTTSEPRSAIMMAPRLLTISTPLGLVSLVLTPDMARSVLMRSSAAPWRFAISLTTKIPRSLMAAPFVTSKLTYPLPAASICTFSSVVNDSAPGKPVTLDREISRSASTAPSCLGASMTTTVATSALTSP